MTYANHTTDMRFGGLFGRIQGFRTMLADVMQQRAVYARTVQELQALSNRELADLGIHRSEIARIAAESAFKS